MNPTTAQARTIVDELVRHQVRDVVVCPGSRSAPLALALAAAERSGHVWLHVRVDERTAGFLALGLAAGSGRPVPVLVTSGTAVANLHPALVEASLSGIPVLALTANRPPELRGVGANQTIDQVGLFGSYVREVVELGVAGDPAVEHRHWRTGVGRAVLRATDPRDPGPVQIDLAFREPLVPGAGDEDGAAEWQGRRDGRPWLHRPAAGDGAGAGVACAVDLTRRTLVVAGAGARGLPELFGVPTVAEPGAPVPLHPVHPLALDGLDVEQVVVIGRPTLHRSVSRLLADRDIDLVVLGTGGGSGIVDPVGAAAEFGDSVLVGWAPDPEWIATTGAADVRARAAVDEILDEAAAGGRVTGLHVARTVVRGLRAGDHLVCGASNAIRDVAIAGPPGADVGVHANRGASGIDGTVSTAIGLARAVPGRTVALLGDVTFLHDVGGLLLGPLERRPRDLTIVVADDDGGGIFALLEQGDPRFAGDFDRVFGTPHGADLGALCAGYGADFLDVGTDLDRLAEVLAGTEPAGLRVVRVATDRSGLRDLHASVRAAIKTSAQSETTTSDEAGRA